MVDPLGKYLSVGYDLTPWLSAVDLEFSASASTLAIRTDGSAEKSEAKASHVGAKVLQSVTQSVKDSAFWLSNQFRTSTPWCCKGYQDILVTPYFFIECRIRKHRNCTWRCLLCLDLYSRLL